MQKLIRYSVFSFILVFSVNFAFSSSVTQRETIQQEFDRSGIQSVSVINVNGNIDLRTGGDKITMSLVRQVTAESENAAYETLNCTAVYVSKSGTCLIFNSPVPDGIKSYRVDYVLYVPAGMPVDLKTVNGKVVCKDRNSHYKIESGVSAEISLGNKEVTTTISDSKSDTTEGENSTSDNISTFSRINRAVNSLIHALPSVNKVLHESE